MKTIKENLINEITINKSRFITEIIKIDNTENIEQELKKIKNKYKDATHYCYAYIIDNNKKCSDDKEPSGTAGVPIMDTLEKYNLNNILCVVIRYFGGIKLGAGGLIRAYRRSVSETLTNQKLNTLIDGYELIIEVPYDKQKNIESLLKNNYTKEYKENVIYKINCDKETKEILEKEYNLNNIKEKTIEV